MAIGHLYTRREGLTIMNLGAATAENYRRSAKMTQQLLARTQDKGERRTIGEMVGECEYAAEWLETGRRPGSVRGVERGYEERCWDPAWLEAYDSHNSRYRVERDSVSRDLTDDERFRLDEAMRDLSNRERQCFILHHADGMTFEEIGAELALGRSTVQSYIERATEKIEHAKLTNLFLLG
ncbi:sigma-70 family RNA polymerase sigma factor [Cohnella sp. GCM10012308]|uniref:sigma-70 family RNA polymerase sigma factor n=1 Tax=Cohnella sp. GCM10012308 TaxID=3317329 RepID=UPI00361B76F9